MDEKELIRELLPQWRQDPLKFFVDVLDVKEEHIWLKMREMCESVRDNKRTAVKAAHSVSKTYTAARIVLWFLYCFEPATVITTAPSHQQVEEVLWREIRSAHANARIPLGGKVTNLGIDLGEKWFATGFSTRPDTVTQQATSFQGRHNEHVLIVFDEAAGIMKEIWEAADSLISDGSIVRFLAVGNPTSATGDFVDCFKSSLWHKITISVFDTPNYQQNKIVIPGLSGRDYVEETKIKYGEESPYYKSRVLGEIPEEDIDALLKYSDIEKAIGRDFEMKGEKIFATLDVADGGDDAIHSYAWRNKTIVDEIRITGKRMEEAEPYLWRFWRKNKCTGVIVDYDGVGRVMVKLLRAASDDNFQIIPFAGSDTKNCGDDYLSTKAEAAWMMRTDFIDGEVGIPDDPELIEELANYRTDASRGRNGKIALEKKIEMSERIKNSSPDKGDNVIMMSWGFSKIKYKEKPKDKWRKSRGSDEYNWRVA